MPDKIEDIVGGSTTHDLGTGLAERCMACGRMLYNTQAFIHLTSGGYMCSDCFRAQEISLEGLGKKSEFPPTRLGWECPRCHAIHSPESTRCLCPPRTTWTALGTGAATAGGTLV